MEFMMFYYFFETYNYIIIMQQRMFQKNHKVGFHNFLGQQVPVFEN